MAPKKPRKSDPQKHELEAFAEKYDTYALIYGDPVEVMFSIMDASMQGKDFEVALRAADMLNSYRFPRVKPQDKPVETGKVLNLTIIQGGVPQAKMLRAEIDVTPERNDIAALLGQLA